MGLQLRDAEDRSGVIVGDVSAGSAASQQGVPVGGTLLRLNAIDLAGMSKAQVGKLLGKTGRPLTMQVAAPPPPPPVVMEHTFGAGPMGLALHDSDDGVSVRDVAGGSAAESMGIVAGSLLVRLNDIDLAGMSKAQVGKLLGKAARPMCLTISVAADETDHG